MPTAVSLAVTGSGGGGGKSQVLPHTENLGKLVHPSQVLAGGVCVYVYEIVLTRHYIVLLKVHTYVCAHCINLALKIQ